MAITSVVCEISMQSLFSRQGLCYREFSCDNPVHKGQRDVTMATNFGTKIAIRAYKCISMRDNENAITYNRGFCGRPIQRRHFCLQVSKGRQPNFGQNRQKNMTKMATTSIVCVILIQSLVFG